jgi:glutathione S-transferase
MTVLKIYHNPVSTNSRHVGIAWLEQEIELELVSLKLNGEKFQPGVGAISPFHHVPVLADGIFI